ncbi:MAG TPA: hypothetical protein VF950_07155 [Planctomycetota bacterium]
MIDLLLSSLALLQEEQGLLHPFIAKALASPHAIRSNFFVTAEGKIIRSSVVLKKEGLPGWVHDMADQKLGKGEDLEYEAEVYPDGSQVYEVYRRIDGREKQMSVRVDGTLFYIGTEHPVSALPPAVSGALAMIPGFEAKQCVSKEGPAFHEYHVKGAREGGEFRARVGKDGRLIALQRRVPSTTEFEVVEPRSE